ncbi:MAG TPA: hypothetical protein VHH36_05255 [Candidatus Thermoplasmatota archaeon]|nr:hypothetical protein [Candidatus Thermoplasmatota archaeon]
MATLPAGRLLRLHALRTAAARVPRELTRALPYAIVLGVALGLVLVVGAHLSNAQPSEKRPFGWPGPASFENGVAMVRGDLLLAATIPALLLGARALDHRAPGVDGPMALARAASWHLLALGLGAVLAAAIGAWGASRTPFDAWMAFVVAHGLLAMSFYAIGFAWAATLRRHAVAAAVATWAFFVLLFENAIQWRVMREAGYNRLLAGDFPTWFYVAQALSPLSAYRGILILWRDGFRTYREQVALQYAQLPGWMNPGVFSAFMIALWIALPIGLALGAWRWRQKRKAAVAA